MSEWVIKLWRKIAILMYETAAAAATAVLFLSSTASFGNIFLRMCVCVRQRVDVCHLIWLQNPWR